MEKERNMGAPGRGQVVFSTDARDFFQVAESVPCQTACPARTNIPGYIKSVYDETYGTGYEVNRGANVLPGVLGRICSRPCEAACRHGDPENGESVGICHLKRSCADLKPSNHKIQEAFYAPSGKRVAVVGSGPAGLAAAGEEGGVIAGGYLHAGMHLAVENGAAQYVLGEGGTGLDEDTDGEGWGGFAQKMNGFVQSCLPSFRNSKYFNSHSQKILTSKSKC